MRTKTYSQRNEDVQRGWKIVDADGKVLGRLATRVATSLRGKDKPTFTPHIDGGDFVVVINAEKVKITGAKAEKKVYYHHTGWMGGLKQKTAGKMIQEKPEEVIRKAVWGMLPKGPLGRQLMTKLKIYRGAEHPHTAQEPKALEGIA